MDVGDMAWSSSTAADTAAQREDEIDLRRGPWTVEEDFLLVNYIATHGEGRWNSLARSAGLKRTGKSCRLRWLNYLRPDVRRGNITPEEQLLILELHSRWGNRWSKIAQYLPGRTDNEIKNYWRTRVQKHAKQLQCDVNSKQFKDLMRYLWMPRLVERIQAAAATTAATTAAASSGTTAYQQPVNEYMQTTSLQQSPDHSSMAGSSSDSVLTQFTPPPPSYTAGCSGDVMSWTDEVPVVAAGQFPENIMAPLPSPCGYLLNPAGSPDFAQNGWAAWGTAEINNNSDSFWSMDDIWSLQQQQQQQQQHLF